MKLRWILSAGVALTLTANGCDKKEQEEQAKAAAAAAEQAKKAEEQAKQQVAEATKQVEEAAKSAEEAAKAAAEAVQKAEEEAKAKLAAAQEDAAKKIEEAKAAGEDEAKKKVEEEAAAAAEAEKQKLIEQKDTLIQVAIDIGCMKKKETDAQKMQQEETDLLGAAELDQRTFLNNIEALKVADATVGQQIDDAVGACPSAEDVIRGKVLGVQVFNVCLREANVKPERMGALQKEILESYDLSGEEFNRLRDQYKNEPWFKPSLDEGVKSCPPIAEEDIETAEESQAKAPKTAEGRPAPRPARQAFKGTLFGSSNGKMNVVLVGTKMGSGNIDIAGLSMPVSGYVTDNGKVTFKAISGANNLRGFGKVDTGGRRILGNWNGTLNGQRKSGSFILQP